MSYDAIIALLKTALLLLTLAQGPNVPPSLHDKAVNVANQAIAAARQSLSSSQALTVGNTGGGGGGGSSSSAANAQSNKVAAAAATSTQVQSSSVVSTAVAATSTQTNSSATSQKWGWDPGLKKRCIRGANTSSLIRFKDEIGCTDASKQWTLAIGLQSFGAANFYGDENQSLPVTTDGSGPIHFNWTDTPSGGVVRMKTDWQHFSNPAGAPWFSWYAFMDRIGPFPRADKLRFNATIHYNDLETNGVARGFVGAQVWWDNIPHAIEIDFTPHTFGTGNPFPNASWVYSYRTDATIAASYAGDPYAFAAVDGAFYGVQIQKGTDQKLSVDIGGIYQDLIARGVFQAPTSGWSNAVVSGIFIGTEVYNSATTSSSMADLYISNAEIVSN